MSCAQGRHITALYALHEGEYVPYILGVPEFATARFRGLYPDGVPAATPLTVRGTGPLAQARDDTARLAAARVQPPPWTSGRRRRVLDSVYRHRSGSGRFISPSPRYPYQITSST